jgi:hypothetical protein
VAADNICQRPNSDKFSDLPIVGYQLSNWSYTSKDDHHCYHRDTPNESYLELLDDCRNLLKERGIGRFFGGGAPGHVDAKKMAEDGLGDVDGNTAKEGSQDEEPSQVLEYYGQSALGVAERRSKD